MLAHLSPTLDGERADTGRTDGRHGADKVGLLDAAVQRRLHRAHLGACAGADPLLGLFSLVTLWEHGLHATQTPTPRAASWYSKPLPTFSDALARVRRELWMHHDFHTSPVTPDLVKLPRTTTDALIGAACYAA